MRSSKIPQGFKPCYKWIAFNTHYKVSEEDLESEVLNLVING